MGQKTGRNEACPCGSGMKFKSCCGSAAAIARERQRKVNTAVAAVVFGLAGVFAFALILPRGGGSDTGSAAPSTSAVPVGAPLPSSAEIGGPAAMPPAGGAPGSQPPGPAPPGKVWSADHGHWHDAPGAQSVPVQPGAMQPGGDLNAGPPAPNTVPHVAGAPAPQPPGPVPEGKVWSADHGHWHDAPRAPASQPPGPAPEGKVWSADHGHWHDAPGAGASVIEPATGQPIVGP